MPVVAAGAWGLPAVEMLVLVLQLWHLCLHLILLPIIILIVIILALVIVALIARIALCGIARWTAVREGVDVGA